jgi:hypothetical protein
MGHELYRMIRDGAPESWTPLMRMVAKEIADDARPDPSQGLPPDGGWPQSKILLTGRWAAGEWWDGLTERTGLSVRAISRALTELARADYEMREQIGTDKRGRPVFALPGRRRMTFRVPLLSPRKTPDPATHSTPDPATHSTPDPATYSTPDPATSGARAREVAESGSGLGRQIRHESTPEVATLYPLPIPPIPSPAVQVVDSSLEPRTREVADLDGQMDDFDSRETRPRPGPGYGLCTECREWISVQGHGLLARHGLRKHWCHGSRHEPVEPVPCVGCGETGVALSAFAGLCKACRAIGAGTP